MKKFTAFIFIAIIVNCISLTIAQNTESYKIVSTTIVKKEYKNVDTSKWKEINNEWLYKGQKTGISPLFYTCIIDTAQTTEDSNGVQQSMCKMDMRNSTGYYITEELGWDWNKEDTTWYYKNYKSEMYPRTFMKISTETIKNYDCDKNTIIKKTIEIKESYKVSSPLWSWDSKNRIWLLDNEKTNKLPIFTIINAIKSETVDNEYN